MRSLPAIILPATPRGPMAVGGVAGFHEGTRDERLDQSMGGRVAVVGLGVRGRADVQRDGTGYAGASASRGA